MAKKQTHIIYGVITALAMVIITVSLHIAGLSFEPWAQWVSNAAFLIGILMNAVAFSKANEHQVSFGNVFSSGFKMSAIITLITLVWGFISLLIFPEIQEKGMEMARERMAKQGLSDEMIDKQMEFVQKNFKVFMVGGIVFMTMLFGAIFSLIGAGIAKKDNSSPTVQM